MNYLDITKCSVADGKGIRIVLWVAGCEHHCNECQNPQSWDIKNGKLFTEGIKEKIFELLKKPYVWGLTLSGGEPLHPNNVASINNLCSELKEKFPDKDIWLYTGYTLEEIYRREINYILPYIDVLVDGRFIPELKNLTLPFRGSSNQRIIDVKKTLEKNEIVLYETER